VVTGWRQGWFVVYDQKVSLEAESPHAVLLADDDPHSRELLETLLQRHGFRLLQASDASTAIATAEAHDVDAFLLDRMLLETPAGVDVLTWLRTHPRYRLAPVFVLTGPAQSVDHPAGMRDHWAYVFDRGQSPDVLMAYLGRVLGRTMSP
jgi:DNA-binding response OmpR family regulator